MSAYQRKPAGRKRKPVTSQSPHDYFAKMNVKRRGAQKKKGPSLYLKSNGQWAAKINGRAWQFGPDEANARKRLAYDLPYLQAGQEVRHDADGQPLYGDADTGVRQVVNSFLAMKDRQRRLDEISEGSWKDYLWVAKVLVEALGDKPVEGLTPDDFVGLRDLYWSRWASPYARQKAVVLTKTMLRHAEPERGGIINQGVRFGQYFKPPTKKAFRLYRAKRPEKMFQPNVIRDLLDAAETLGAAKESFTAMILLGVNCGYDPSACRRLSFCHLRSSGFVCQPRAKTGVERRCPLWPETQAALEAAVKASRPARDGEAEQAVLRTRVGTVWSTDAIGREMKRLLRQTGHYVEGRTFEAFRHTFATVGEEAPDRAARSAVSVIMGHVDPSMAALYRELVTDDRLLAVTNHVRNWLYD